MTDIVTDPDDSLQTSNEGTDDESPQADEPDQASNEGTDEPSDLAKVKREAKSLRTRLRGVESERDGLLARVETHDRADVERLATSLVSDPSDLFLVRSLDDFRDSEGNISPESVRVTVQQIISEKPSWSRALPNLDQGIPESSLTAALGPTIEGQISDNLDPT